MKSLLPPLALAIAAIGTAVAAENARIEAAPQPPGAEVTVTVSASDKGFVVVHESDAEGKPVAPASIGHAAITSGGQEEVTIQLDRPVEAGETLYVMLHKDTGTEGEYEFGPGTTDIDAPMVANGQPVVVPVAVE